MRYFYLLNYSVFFASPHRAPSAFAGRSRVITSHLADDLLSRLGPNIYRLFLRCLFLLPNNFYWLLFNLMTRCLNFKDVPELFVDSLHLRILGQTILIQLLVGHRHQTYQTLLVVLQSL